MDFEVTIDGLGTTTANVDITEEELNKYEDLICKCNYLETHSNAQPKYVKNYLGVSHGWICPHCKKYVQIG